MCVGLAAEVELVGVVVPLQVTDGGLFVRGGVHIALARGLGHGYPPVSYFRFILADFLLSSQGYGLPGGVLLDAAGGGGGGFVLPPGPGSDRLAVLEPVDWRGLAAGRHRVQRYKSLKLMGILG